MPTNIHPVIIESSVWFLGIGLAQREISGIGFDDYTYLLWWSDISN